MLVFSCLSAVSSELSPSFLENPVVILFKSLT